MIQRIRGVNPYVVDALLALAPKTGVWQDVDR
jgi:hypothetical protein